MLSISSDQKTQILDPNDTYLQEAFAEGVEAGAGQFLAALEGYVDLTPEQQQLIKDTFQLIVAAMLVSMNVKAPLPDVITDGSGASTILTYLDGNDFTPKSLIVQNGLIVGVI